METLVKNVANDIEKSWIFLDGSKRGVVFLDSIIIGEGTYLPGWRWSEHVGKQTGKQSQAHLGYVRSGHMIIQNPQGEERELGPGDAFEIGPGHDAWVTSDEPCVALDFEFIQNKKE
jgi:hypothetical protein